MKTALLFINHLIAEQPETAVLLQAHAGRCIHFLLPPIQFQWSITSEGKFQETSHSTPPDLSIAIPTADVWKTLSLLISGSASLAGVANISGNADLAQSLNQVLHILHWDIEDDLSHFVGDVMAWHIMQTANKIVTQGRGSVDRNIATLYAWMVYEKQWLVDQNLTDEFGTAVAILRDDCARLEQRLIRLEKSLGNRE